ncbi:MAG: hypothetical protein U0V49_09910 [Saprospiraceae bacterium]
MNTHTLLSAMTVIMLCVHTLQAQTIDTSQDLPILQEADHVSDIAETSPIAEETESTEALHLISCSNITAEWLRNLPFLNQKDVLNILKYIHAHGPIYSVLELQSIGDLELDKIRKILRLVDLENKAWSNPWKKKSGLRQDLSGRLSLRMGRKISTSEYDRKVAASYAGSEDRAFLRARLKLRGRFEFGVMAEKDAGEPWWSNRAPAGLDYVTSYIVIEHIHHKVSQWIIGDYRMRIGQGLVIDNSFAAAGSQDPGYLVKPSMILKPYTSLQENNMFRGTSVILRLPGQLSLQLFYSSRRHDASIPDADSSEGRYSFIETLQRSGYHRTVSEINNRDRQHQLLTGAHWLKEWTSASIGISIVHHREDPVFDTVGELYQRWNHSGGAWFGSFHHQILWHRTLLFGESAMTETLQYAHLHGVLRSLGKYADAALLWRNFSPGFNSGLGQTFSSGGIPVNEEGWYAAVNFFSDKEIRMHVEWNTWRHPWPKYNTDLPSEAREWSAKLSWSRKRKWNFYARYGYSTHLQNVAQSHENAVLPVQNQHLRIHSEIRLNSNFTWRARFEVHRFTFGNKAEDGWLFFQDIVYKPMESWFSCSGRLGLVQANSYNTRIYAYENDLLYQFGIPALYGQQVFGYINVRMRINRHFNVECRWAQSRNILMQSAKSPSDRYLRDVKIQLHWIL